MGTRQNIIAGVVIGGVVAGICLLRLYDMRRQAQWEHPAAYRRLWLVQ